jgi:putative membrane protein
MSTLFAFLHHLAAFTLVSAVAVEFVLIGQELTIGTARRLQVADAVLGISATMLLIVGLLRVHLFEKGAAYYFSSHAFLTNSRSSLRSRSSPSFPPSSSCAGASC